MDRGQLLSRRAELRELIAAERRRVSMPNATASEADLAKVDGWLVERDRIDAALSTTGAPAAGRTATVRVGQEERLYRPDYRETGGPSFVRDVYMSQVRSDPAAIERLARHGR